MKKTQTATYWFRASRAEAKRAAIHAKRHGVSRAFYFAFAVRVVNDQMDAMVQSDKQAAK